MLLIWISMNVGTFDTVLLSFGFKIETDVGNNERVAPFWLFGTRDLILDSWFDHGLI